MPRRVGAWWKLFLVEVISGRFLRQHPRLSQPRAAQAAPRHCQHPAGPSPRGRTPGRRRDRAGSRGGALGAGQGRAGQREPEPLKVTPRGAPYGDGRPPPAPRSRLPPPRSRTPGPAGSRGGSAGPALTTMQGLGVAMARPAGAGAGAGAAAGGEERRGAGRRRAPQRPRRRLPRSPPSTWPRRRRPLRPGPGPCEEPPGRRARPPPAARLRELGTHRPWRRVQAAVGAFALRKGTGTRVGRGPLQPVTSGRVGEVSH